MVRRGLVVVLLLIGYIGSGIDSDLEAWMKYDEDSEIKATISVDERLKEFDEMLDSATSFKETWQSREFIIVNGT
jgi:hypothetical protein